ncbi:MAG: hypothetical protein Q8Q32_01670 [bacterium]|nr:hypothetical protein [bacterium]
MLKNLVVEGLKKLFAKYEPYGVLAIYLQGSIVGNDFEIGNSDVDSVAFVSDSVSLDFEKVMRDFLSKNYPDIRDFGIRILYLSEMQDGVSRGGHLSKYIAPALLALDFPSWEHVAGREFSQNDFVKISQGKAVSLRLQHMESRGWRNVEGVELDFLQYYLKTILRIIWHIDQERGRRYLFSYSAVSNRDDEYSEIASIIKKIRDARWDKEIFIKNKGVFQNFVDKMFSSLSSTSKRNIRHPESSEGSRFS